MVIYTRGSNRRLMWNMSVLIQRYVSRVVGKVECQLNGEMLNKVCSVVGTPAKIIII